MTCYLVARSSAAPTLRGRNMDYRKLEARLQLQPGQISAIQMISGPRYRPILLSQRHGSWRNYAEPKVRSVLCPCRKLRVVQSKIERLVSGRFEPHPIAHAYVKGRSIVTNARRHVGKEWLFHVDLVNFFGSITEEQVVAALRWLLFYFSEDDIRAIAQLCCHEGVLPQGSPASPILSNLVCFPLDLRVEADHERLAAGGQCF